MFSFITKRPYLRDLIPGDYTDIHSHLLPGIDDGAKAIEDTAFLVTELSNMGFARFTTTPHVMNNVWDNSRTSIEAKLKETIAELETAGVTSPLKAAAEYIMDTHFVSLFEREKLLTLKDEYVLVEMSYINPPIQLYQIIFDLQLNGYKPVLAHPERYLFYQNDVDQYIKLKNSGCLFQLNLLSVVGYYGIGVAETAKKLLKLGLFDFAGSDVHHKNHLAAFGHRILIKDISPLRAIMENNKLFRLATE